MQKPAHKKDRKGAAPARPTSSPRLARRLAAALVGVECALPGLGHAGGGAVEAARQPIELALDRLAQRVVQRAGLARDLRHGGLDHGLDGRGRGLRAVGEAAGERPVHRFGQGGVGTGGLRVEVGLAGGQSLGQRLVLLLHALHQGLQAVHDLRHGRGLLLHEAEALLALVHGREGPQRGGDVRIERQCSLRPLASVQRRHQAQHGGRRHARHRGAEGQAQPLHRLRQGRAHGLQVGRAGKRGAGAVERDHHAEEGAQHAQQHQQAGQVGRHGRAGQRRALALDAQAHRGPQRGMQRLQPARQAGRRRGEVGHGLRKRRSRLAEAVQLQRAHHVEGGDDQRHGQGQQMAAEVAGADPGDHGQAGKECERRKESRHA